MVSKPSTKIKGPNLIEKAHWRFGNGITWLGWWVCKGGLMAESIEGFCVKSKDLVVSDKNLITPSNCFFLHNPDKFLYAPNIRIKIPQFEHQYSLIEKCHFSFCWKRGLPMIKCKKMAEKGSPVALAFLYYSICPNSLLLWPKTLIRRFAVLLIQTGGIVIWILNRVSSLSGPFDLLVL